MPRNTNGEYYLPPGTEAVKDEIAYSAHVNQRLNDLRADANAPRPVIYGGTGASSAAQARTNLGVRSASDTPALNLSNTFVGNNTFEGVTTFKARVDLDHSSPVKLRLMGSASESIDAYGTTGTRTGYLVFDNQENRARIVMEASGANPSVIFEINRDGTLRINGSAVYHTASKPTAADVGALPANGKAADADKLDGLDSTDFLRSNATANNAANLGGMAPSAYALSSRTVTGGTGLAGGGTLAGNVVINADLSSQAEAQAGASNAKLMTPLRTLEAISAVSVGRSQTWQNPARATNTTYQNTTASPIMVIVSIVTNGNGNVQCGAAAGSMATLYTNTDWDRDAFSFIVPPGHYYRLNSSDPINSWAELR